MEFSKSIIIAAPAAKVWQVGGRDFASVGEWATAVQHSAAKTDIPTVNNSPVGGRVCKTSFGEASEEFTAYDDEKMSYSFKGVFKSPMFNNVTSSMKVTAKGENETEVQITPQLDLTFLGYLMYPMIRMQISKVTDEILDDLKYFVEHGKPSPRKLASQKK